MHFYEAGGSRDIGRAARRPYNTGNIMGKSASRRKIPKGADGATDEGGNAVIHI